MQRPERLLLVWGHDSFHRWVSHTALVWKEGRLLRRMQAGQRTLGSLHDFNSISDAPLTVDSVVRELRDVGVFFPGDLKLEAFDVSEHLGRYHPRVRRGEILDGHFEPQLTLSTRDCGLEAALASGVVAAKLLFEELEDICTIIEPHVAQLNAYGHRLRHLLITACTEVESAWSSVFRANADCEPERRLNTNDYIRLANPMKLRERSVLFTRCSPPRQVTPFASWEAARPTESLPWYVDYNATKHNREINLNRATLGNAIEALAALYIMLVAQFGGEAEEQLPSHPFATDPDRGVEFWSERNIQSPFADGPWQERKLFPGP